MGRFAAKLVKTDYQQPVTTNFEFLGPHGSIFTILLLPLTVLSLYFACSVDGCPPSAIYSLKYDQITIPALVYDRDAVKAYIGWIAFHLALSIVTPGKTVEGAVTPDGKRLKYKINGFNSFLVTMSLLSSLVYRHGLKPLLWVADHYVQLAIAGILFAFTLSLALYLRSFRSNQVVVSVCGNSGYPIYDFWMGRELNPRVFGIDLKYVCELRPGLIGWFVLNLALAARQYQNFNTITNAMVLVLIGQGYYVIDALWNESAILTTMDITTDGFGFMLVFGDLVWVPFTYSLQARYLSLFPVDLSAQFLVFIFALNLFGLYVFRSSNSEKNQFRTDPNHSSVAHLKFMDTARGTKLLTSGWWGLARKINYTGDWLMAVSWCLPCGFDSAIPYFYAVYFLILLIHRAHRDDELCRQKYGKDWETYCKKVPYTFVPGVF
ncbi:erg24, C-14 sterol reductase [Boothiomyces sp. JEL0866]|nr:erg24, C-14 sterol reductase [Boothiomyces sp. JEL0866]